MPRACTVCAHPKRKVIDAMIADGQPYLRIATKFGLNDKTVNTHGKKHVHPFIKEVELQVQAEVMTRVRKYRDEVNLPLAEKSKHIENRLWDDYERCKSPVQRVVVIRAIREQQQEQARLTGAYQQARPNDDILVGMVRGYAVLAQEFREHEGRDPLPTERNAIINAILDLNGRRIDENAFIKALEHHEIDSESGMVH